MPGMGIRNDVSDVNLLQADVAESWREGDRDYATAAMRYSSRDVSRDRASGKIVDGDDDEPTEATELWTFTRQDGGDWKLSANSVGLVACWAEPAGDGVHAALDLARLLVGTRRGGSGGLAYGRRAT